MEFNTLNDILEFAIGEEEAAVNFYTMLAGQSKNEEIKAVFVSFAKEEMGHKARLTGVRETGLNDLGGTPVKDLKIADYLVDISPRPDMPYPEALILAMKKEKAAFRLYSALSERVTDPAHKQLFSLLAQEEARHKLRFELEYDEHVLKEN